MFPQLDTRPQRSTTAVNAKRLALLLPMAILAGCGGGEAEPLPPAVATHTGILSRLVTEARLADGTAGEVVDVTAFRLTSKNRKDAPWLAQGGEKIVNAFVRPPGGSKERADLLPALVARGKGAKSFTHSAEFKRGDVNAVQLVLSCYGSGTEELRVVTLNEDGNAAEASEVVTITARPEPHFLEVVIPRSTSKTLKRTGLRVEIKGKQNHAGLLSVKAFNAPVQDLMPAVGSGSEVELDHSTRLAAGLVEGTPWEVDLSSGGAEDGAVTLQMSLAIPDWAGEVADEAKVSLAYDSVTGPAQVEIEIPDDAEASWQDVSVKLDDVKAGDLALRLSLTDDDTDVQSVVLIGDPVLTQRVKAPQTIVLITSDTHRADHMGLARANAVVDTPVLDRLGRRGVYFTDCQSTTNVTNPSHIAILSGIHPRDTQIVDNTTQLAPEAETLAEVFQAQGYRTFAAISTQHLEPSQSGLGQGFDRFESTDSFKRTGDHAVRQLEKWLADSEGVSTFVWLHLFDAHAPYDPPKGTRKSALSGLSKTDGGLGLDEKYVPRWISREGIRNGDYVDALYRGEVDWVDDALTDLLESPRLKDAWIAFTSDHGESLRSHNVYWDHAGLYLPMVDVPLIIAGPGVEALRSDTTVQQLDVGRTLINLAGIENSTYPGRDLVQAAVDEAPDEPRFAIAAHGLQASVSAGPWFYVMDLRDFTNEDAPHTWTHGRGQLFDRRKGVNTEENQVEDEAERASRMRQRLIEFLGSGSSKALGSASSIDESAQENLKALGYAGFTARTESTWWTPPAGEAGSSEDGE